MCTSLVSIAILIYSSNTSCTSMLIYYCYVVCTSVIVFTLVDNSRSTGRRRKISLIYISTVFSPLLVNSGSIPVSSLHYHSTVVAIATAITLDNTRGQVCPCLSYIHSLIGARL